MKRAETLYYPFPVFPEGQAPGIDIKYTVPFEWGALHVSEAADRAYDLVPLTANTRDGYVAADTSGKAASRVFIVGPGEMDIPPVEGTNLYVTSGVYGKAVQVVAMLGKTSQSRISDVQQITLEAAQQATLLDDDELQMAIDNGNIELPSVEDTANTISQVVLHNLVRTLEQPATNAWMSLLRAERAERQYAKIRNLSAFTLLLSAGMVAGFTAANHGSTPPYALAMTGLYLTIGIGGTLVQLRQDATQTNVSALSQARLANAIANGMREDIHKTYCASHFATEHAENDFPLEP